MDFEVKINNTDLSIDSSPPDDKAVVGWEFWDGGELYQFVMELVEAEIYFEFKPSEGKTRVNLLEEQWHDKFLET